MKKEKQPIRAWAALFVLLGEVDSDSTPTLRARMRIYLKNLIVHRANKKSFLRDCGSKVPLCG
jgi:hypothetical protein